MSIIIALFHVSGCSTARILRKIVLERRCMDSGQVHNITVDELFNAEPSLGFRYKAGFDEDAVEILRMELRHRGGGRTQGCQ